MSGACISRGSGTSFRWASASANSTRKNCQVNELHGMPWKTLEMLHGDDD